MARDRSTTAAGQAPSDELRGVALSALDLAGIHSGVFALSLIIFRGR